ncbi:MAG: hypothetical protein IIU19_00920 [Oscillospiraceae bacterium]|jgi:hypothetical protein|nr:hypothetical protein [Oscillospiraceae bacterium]MBQ4240933.1 hypothetical protein [Oscillospiraceae bacterium]MBQ5411924.1 hypothetical protein [Oscillospiraceae bacterium]
MTEIFRTLGPLLGTFGGMGTVVFVGLLLFRIIKKQDKKNTVAALCLCIVCLILGILLTPKD